jgi:membrane fusion protein (multidrug efflux system)
MKRTARNTLVVIVIACLLAGIYWFYSEKQPPKTKIAGVQKEAKEPAASVNVVPIKRAAISTSISAYGEVVPAPGAIQVVSVPYESQVFHLMVSNAQKISVNDALLEIGLSPNTKLRLEQAQNEYEISQKSLRHMQELFDLKLATNNQLLQAEQAFQQAELRLESLKQQGIDSGKQQVIRANVTGLVSKVYVQEGVIVPAGNPLVEIVAQNRLEVRLELEPEDIVRLHPGQPVLLAYVDVPASKVVTGEIRKISRAVNPASRLTDVFVTLPGSEKFLLGEYILGKITVASSYGLVVPRSAILPEKGKYILFTVRGGRAVKHIVKLGLESANEAEVSAADLRPGEQVVIMGNYELTDGMAVRVETSK